MVRLCSVDWDGVLWWFVGQRDENELSGGAAFSGGAAVLWARTTAAPPPPPPGAAAERRSSFAVVCACSVSQRRTRDSRWYPDLDQFA